MIHLVTYDLNNPGKNYDQLYKAIKSCGQWWHYLDSTWLIDTNMNSSSIYTQLASSLDQNDNIFIVRITHDYQGWLPQKAWDWINAHMKAAA